MNIELKDKEIKKEKREGSSRSISIVIPAYNESKRIHLALDDINNYTKTNNSLNIKEVIVVSDGSKDNTVEIVKSWIDKMAFKKEIYKIVDYMPNRGKGYAVREGFLNAGSDYILYTDADGASPITELEKLFSEMLKGFDVACGSRVLKGEKAEVHMSIKRRLVGFTFQTILKGLGLAELDDTQCGFKLFRKDVVEKLVENQQCFNFSFDIEYLFLAKKYHFKIKEVPITWNQVEGSKVNILRDSIKMLYEVLKIRFIYRYD